MGGQACKAKIILNGSTIESEVHALCYEIQELKDLDDAVGYKMIDHLNVAEDLIFKAKRVYLESQGFTGPWPHSLSSRSDYEPH